MANVTYKAIIMKAISAFNSFQNKLTALGLFNTDPVIEEEDHDTYKLVSGSLSVENLETALQKAAGIKLNSGTYISGKFTARSAILGSTGSTNLFDTKDLKVVDNTNLAESLTATTNATNGTITIKVRDLALPNGYYYNCNVKNDSFSIEQDPAELAAGEIRFPTGTENAESATIFSFTPTISSNGISGSLSGGYYITAKTNSSSKYIDTEIDINCTTAGYLVAGNVGTASSDIPSLIKVQSGSNTLSLPTATYTLSFGSTFDLLETNTTNNIYKILQNESNAIGKSIKKNNSVVSSDSTGNEYIIPFQIDTSSGVSITNAGYITSESNDSDEEILECSVSIPAAATYNGYVESSGFVKRETQMYAIEYDPTNKCVDFIFN